MSARCGKSGITEPTTITPRTMTGGDVFVYRLRSATRRVSPCVRSTVPLSPKLSSGLPVRASSATIVASPVTRISRASAPSRQYATPRCTHPRPDAATRRL
jgi:hypothetical protein